MSNERRIYEVNKFVHGSIWKWETDKFQDEEYKKGVQSKGRPVLIISNDSFNLSSPVVNCFTISSTLNNSPVHVPIILDNTSHIQCEQWHTVPKTELSYYMGFASPLIMSNVKEKIKLQCDMYRDMSVEILTSIKASVDGLAEQAAKGFGLPDTENDILKIMTNIGNLFEVIKTELVDLKSNIKQGDSEDKNGINQVIAEREEKPVNSGDKKQRKKRRVYSDEDINYLLDENNTPEMIMSKLNFKDKATVQKMQYYFKKKRLHTNDKDNDTLTVKKDKKGGYGKRREYTEDDVLYILDTSNSTEDIMSKYGYKDNRAVYNIRTRLKKKYSL